MSEGLKGLSPSPKKTVTSKNPSKEVSTPACKPRLFLFDLILWCVTFLCFLLQLTRGRKPILMLGLGIQWRWFWQWWLTAATHQAEKSSSGIVARRPDAKCQRPTWRYKWSGIVSGRKCTQKDLLNALKDGRRWNKNYSSNWASHKRVWYADCKGSCRLTKSIMVS